MRVNDCKECIVLHHLLRNAHSRPTKETLWLMVDPEKHHFLAFFLCSDQFIQNFFIHPTAFIECWRGFLMIKNSWSQRDSCRKQRRREEKTEKCSGHESFSIRKHCWKLKENLKLFFVDFFSFVLKCTAWSFSQLWVCECWAECPSDTVKGVFEVWRISKINVWKEGENGKLKASTFNQCSRIRTSNINCLLSPSLSPLLLFWITKDKSVLYPVLIYHHLLLPPPILSLHTSSSALVCDLFTVKH